MLPVLFSAGEVDEDYIYAATFQNKIWRRPITDVLTYIEDQNFRINYTLLQNYPNPFTESTTITWQLSQDAHVVLKVYDFTGRELKTLVSCEMTKGEHKVEFDATGLPAGVYFYQLRANGVICTNKMIICQ